LGIADVGRALFREHLGATAEEMERLKDPLAHYVELVMRRAQRNTRIYRQVFHCTPDDCVNTWEEYDAFTKQKGHDRAQALELLADVRGHLVEFPTQFLNRANLIEYNSLSNTETFVPNEVFT